MMFSAVIFDMDGLLVDSEPFWRAAEIQVFDQHLGLHVTPEQCAETMGMRIDHVVDHWLTRHPRPDVAAERVVQAIVEEMCNQMREHGQALPGVHDLVTWMKHRDLPLAVASSSPRRLIDVVLSRLQLAELFNVVHSAEDEAHGKPHPAVYLTAARLLGVQAKSCLVFEDSVAGLQSAQAAGMCVVAVPAADQQGNPGYQPAQLIIDSLEYFTSETLTSLAATWHPATTVRG